MTATKLAPMTVALTMAFTTPAIADCLYTFENGSLQSQSHGNQNELLGDRIEVFEGLEREVIEAVGSNLHFECLYTRNSETGAIDHLRSEQPYAPTNLYLLPDVDRITDTHSIKLSLTNIVNIPFMTASVECGNIELEFDAYRLGVSNWFASDEDLRTFHETTIRMLFTIATAIENDFTDTVDGTYQMGVPGGTIIHFPPMTPPSCMALTS